MKTIAHWREIASKDPLQAARAWLALLEAQPAEARQAAIAWAPDERTLADAFARGVTVDGCLAGAPYGLKDLFDVAGVPTKAGSSFLAEVRPTPTQDTRLVEILAEAGAVMAAKVGMVEFAYGMSGENIWYGDVPNPKVPNTLAGGSSSGSAWAVASGLVPFSIGTDTAGSMRVPAAYCGLYSWRAKPGPLTAQGCFPLAPSFDTAGWFTSEPELLLMLNDVFLGESEPCDSPCVLDLTSLSPSLSSELEVAGQTVLGRMNTARDSAAIELATKAFSDGARAYNVMGSCEAYAVHEAWLDDYRDRYDPVVWCRIDRGRNWGDEDIAFAAAKQAEVMAAWDHLFDEYDAVAMPITPIASPGKAEMTEDYRTELLNLTAPASIGRCPALTIPLRLPDASSGGLQFLFRDNPGGVARTLLKA